MYCKIYFFNNTLNYIGALLLVRTIFTPSGSFAYLQTLIEHHNKVMKNVDKNMKYPQTCKTSKSLTKIDRHT